MWVEAINFLGGVAFALFARRYWYEPRRADRETANE